MDVATLPGDEVGCVKTPGTRSAGERTLGSAEAVVRVPPRTGANPGGHVVCRLTGIEAATLIAESASARSPHGSVSGARPRERVGKFVKHDLLGFTPGGTLRHIPGDRNAMIREVALARTGSRAIKPERPLRRRRVSLKQRAGPTFQKVEVSHTALLSVLRSGALLGGIEQRE